MERDLTHQPMPGEANAAGIDLEQMADAIWEEMKGLIDKRDIRRALEEILPGYQEARIWGFVPILMRRDVSEMLSRGTLSSTGLVPA